MSRKTMPGRGWSGTARTMAASRRARSVAGGDTGSVLRGIAASLLAARGLPEGPTKPSVGILWAHGARTQCVQCAPEIMTQTDPHPPAPGVTPPPAQASEPSYDAAYFASHCGLAYERNDHWLTFFGRVAEHIARDIAPASSLDVGCAMGFLVEALADRGVDAHGIDISDYAIGKVRDDIKPRCRVASALEPFGRRLRPDQLHRGHRAPAGRERRSPRAEHLRAQRRRHLRLDTARLPGGDARQRQPSRALGRAVRPLGFHRDLTYDLTYLAPWAMRFRRSRDPLPRHRARLRARALAPAQREPAAA